MAKTKKKQLSEAAQLKRNQKTKKSLNPFEIHINRDKQNVIGKKSKADRGLPGVARSKAINKRKGTLLQEYKLKNKNNVFLDKRIGAKSHNMSEEERAMARYTAERIKLHKKKNIFNLNDEEVLTHKGQTLEEIEKFDDPKSDDEFSDNENRTGKLEGSFVEDAHFGGGILSKSEPGKSRKDLIEQLIAESKKRKAERQKIQEQTQDLTEKLDAEWKDLCPIIVASNKSLEVTVDKPKVDDYDIAIRELKFEARGTPSDKLKSEEEIIKEEKKKLETLEADRLARMKGFLEEDNIRHKSADDLDDGFIVEPIGDKLNEEENNSEEKIENNVNSDAEDSDDNENVETDDEEGDDDNEDDDENNANDDDDDSNKNKNNDSIDNNDENLKECKNSSNTSNVEDSESEDSNADNFSDLKESDSSSDDENQCQKKSVKFTKQVVTTPKDKNVLNSVKLKSILKSKDNVDVQQLNKKTKEEIKIDLLKRKDIMEKAREELPYTFTMPESFDELQKLLIDCNPEYQSVIVDRIIKCNHWTLNVKNKDKLSNLFLYLLQHLNNSAKEDSLESIVTCFQIFDRLSPYLYDLAQINPENTKTFIQDIIREKHECFEANKKKYPSLDTLIFFKLVSLLFPTSDFRHPVVTPCIIFMSQILLRCRVRSRTDLSKGIFICTLMLEYTVLSKRFAPSVINYLRGIIYMTIPKYLVQGTKIVPPFKTVKEINNLLVLDEDIVDFDLNVNTTLMKADDLICNQLDNLFKIRVLLTTVNLLSEFKNNLEELEAVYAIFEPILKLLRLHKLSKYPATVKKHIKKFRKDIEQLRDKKLEYIVLEKKRPKPLRLYEPRIETVYDHKKHKPMSKEKAEREKLLHKYKKEMKGAIREIRRDRAFLAKVNISQQIENDAERKRKVKEIFGEAAAQQSELKKMKRRK